MTQPGQYLEEAIRFTNLLQYTGFTLQAFFKKGNYLYYKHHSTRTCGGDMEIKAPRTPTSPVYKPSGQFKLATA
jgi:hypothetical protein